MATLRKHLRDWTVSRDTIGDVTPSAAALIGINDRANAITLKRVNGPGRLVYTTGGGIYVKIAPFSVPRVVSWDLLQVFTVEPEDPFQDPPEVTGVRARLWDGATEFWYTGGAWTAVSDTDTDWNTVEEVNNALGDWDLDRDLGLVFELSTTDERFTPTLSRFRVLYSVDLVSPIDDWVYGALIGGMKESLRVRSDVIVVSDGTTSIDLGAVVDAFESPYEVTDVDAVWNEDDDSNHRSDLLSGYDTGTRTITLTGAPANGARLLIRFEWVPTVALDTSQDYDELDRSPSILFDRVTLEDLGEAPTGDGIVNVWTSPPTAVKFPAARLANLDLSLLLSAPLSVDLHRLAQAATEFFQARRVVTSPTTGERATLRIVETLDDQRVPNLSDLRTASGLVRLERIHYHAAPTVDGYAVGTLNLTTVADTGDALASNDIETGG